MAIKYYETYPQRWESPSQDYPQGAFKNLSALGEQDGSYLDEKWLNDQSGFFGALLRNAEMTPNGLVDTAQRSQFYDALLVCARKAVNLGNYYTKEQVDEKVVNEWGDRVDVTLSQDFLSKYTQRQVDTLDELIASLSDQSIKGVTLKAGIYDLTGKEILIQGKNHIGSGGEFGPYVVDLTGCEFRGKGTIIIDSSKRVTIKGFRAAESDVLFNGAWWCVVCNCQFRRLILGNVGLNFSDNYWNSLNNVLFQNVLRIAENTSATNSLSFNNCTMRGDAQQGFRSSFKYAFEILGNGNCQDWKFTGDISYHSDKILYSESIADIELNFDAYFDTLLPISEYGNNVVIKARGHYANGNGLDVNESSLLRNDIILHRRDRNLSTVIGTGINYVKNGNLSCITNIPEHFPLYVNNDIQASFHEDGLKVASNKKGTFFRTLPSKFSGAVTLKLIVKLADGVDANVQFRVGNKYYPTKLTSSEYTYITITDNDYTGSGAIPASFNLIDVDSADILFRYIEVSNGYNNSLNLRNEVSYNLVEHTASIPDTNPNTSSYFEVAVDGVSFEDVISVTTNGGVGNWLIYATVPSRGIVRIYARNMAGVSASLTERKWYIKAERL